MPIPAIVAAGAAIAPTVLGMMSANKQAPSGGVPLSSAANSSNVRPQQPQMNAMMRRGQQLADPVGILQRGAAQLDQLDPATRARVEPVIQEALAKAGALTQNATGSPV